VYRSLRKKGLRIPEDMSIVGYDGHDFAQTLGITTIAQPVPFLGQLAASQVMAHIEKPDSPDSQIVVPTELVVRQSVLKIN
jgi:DNA-binding LacI/PurR family transcriptional regulator